MQYRSTRMKAAAGVDVVKNDRFSPRERYVNIGLDLLATPLVALGPRRSVTLGDATRPLEYNFRRWSWRSERAVEVAVARAALAGVAPDRLLEVGNVLHLYGVTGHTVVDKYEQAPGVLNVDVLDYRPEQAFDLVVCISTLEHVGWDEDPQDPAKATAALDALARLGDRLLVTIPVGYHRPLEPAFVDGPFDSVRLAVKTSRLGRWEERPLTEVPAIRFGHPYACGNGVLIGRRGLAD